MAKQLLWVLQRGWAVPWGGRNVGSGALGSGVSPLGSILT